MIIKIVTAPSYLMAFGPFGSLEEAWAHDERRYLPDWVISHGNVEVTLTTLNDGGIVK